MLLYSLTFCLALVTLGLCDDQTAAILETSKEQTKAIGQEAEFNCTVKNHGKFTVLWYKLNKSRTIPILLSTNKTLVTPDERMSIKYNESTSTYTFNIKDLTEADTGFYRCQIIISTNYDELKLNEKRDIELQIRRAPSINKETTTLFVNITEGEPLNLHCDADGYPKPSITWKRENDALLPNGGVTYRDPYLNISKSHRDDRGVYYCEAHNDVNATDQTNTSVNITVKIEFAPVIHAVRPRIGQATGYKIGLECHVEAYPRPTVTWFRNNKELQKGELNGPGDEFLATYYVPYVSSGDFGEYICRADNKWGKANAKIELFETEIPIRP